MGGLGAMLGLILMLASGADRPEAPLRAALSLSALFYGILLSQVVLQPMSRRAVTRKPHHSLV